MPNRSGSGYAQFIPLTAKIGPISTVIDPNRRNPNISTGASRIPVS